MKIYRTILFMTALIVSQAVAARQLPAQAVCVVPVTNAFNDYVQNKFPGATEQQIEDLYRNVLASNVRDDQFMRLHQLLFHQIVTVVDQCGNELLVQCSDHFSQNTDGQKAYNTYAVHAQDFVFLDEITDVDKLPTPHTWYDETSFAEDRTIFTLRKPSKGFSVGTRFKIKHKERKEIVYTDLLTNISHAYYTETVTVFVLSKKTFITITFDQNEGLINSPRTLSEKEQCILEQFKLACSGETRFPTAFGGNSTTAQFEKYDYQETSLTLPNGTSVEGFTRSQKGIQSGYTMPELTMALETMCGVPSFFKNSTTWYRLGTPLQPGQSIKQLDYICGKGYVGRVMSVEENTIADIRSYMHHHGIARIVPVGKNFRGIETYDDLVAAFHEGKPLKLYNDNQTEIIAIFKPGEWRILSFNPNYDQARWAAFAKQYH